MDAAGKLYSCMILIYYFVILVKYWRFLPLLFSIFSMPMAAELMETCIDDVLGAPGVPTVTATDEAGPSNTYATPSVTGEDPLSLSGEAT